MAAAEDLETGVQVEWDKAPNTRVDTPPGQMALMGWNQQAPSTTGKIVGRSHDGLAVVQFYYRTALGGFAWSEGLAVLPGQPCKE